MIEEAAVLVMPAIAIRGEIGYCCHMIVLSVENISKTLKDEPLFQDVTFGMEKGERLGLIGRNGSGKTTFLRVLSGELESDSGTIARSREMTMSLLTQGVSFAPGATVGDYLLSGDHPRLLLLKEYHEVLHEVSNHQKGAQQRLHHLMEKMENAGCWDVQTGYVSLLSELNGPALTDRMDTLSGGLQKKAAIARILAAKPDFLLLDEPTNHLDIPTIEWLESHLIASDTTMIVVTHDRYVLNRLCTSILEIDNRRCYSYPGSYTTFLERREARLLDQQSEQDRLKTILRRELEWLKRGPRARTGKDSGRKQRIETMQESLVSAETEMSSFSSGHRRLGRKILELKMVSKAYDDNKVIKNFSHSFNRGQKIGLIGPNGSGKTTLLDLISGRVQADSGMVDIGVNTVFGYYDQLDREINPRITVLEHVEEIAEQVEIAPGVTVSAARFLELFGFPVSFHRIAIGLLSGGERRRLHLVSMLMGSPNFLLLDEPTNDLDIDTIRRLEQYILDFSGCALIVSHDRAFLDRTTEILFVFDGEGGVTEFPGTFSDYHDYVAQELEARQEEEAVRRQAQTTRPSPQRERERKGLTFQEKREYETILDEIDLLEQEFASLEAGFSAIDANPLTLAERTRRYEQVRALIDRKMERWENLASRA